MTDFSPAEPKKTKLSGGSPVSSEDADAREMEKVQRGDRAAYDRLYQKYRRPIVSFLNTMIQDRAVVDELFQETFLKLYRSREGYEPRAKFSTFLWTIAKRTALDWIEKKKEITVGFGDDEESVPGIDLLLESDLPSAEQALIDHAEARGIEDCIAKLSEPERLLCGLRMHSELSYEEIAAQTGAPLGTVKTKLYRIREKLTKCLRAKAATGGSR